MARVRAGTSGSLEVHIAGYTDVKTHLRSGQAVFTADGAATTKAAARLASDIEQAIEQQLGMEVRVVVRTRAELAKVLKANRFATPAIDPAAYAPEECTLAPGGREIFLWLPNGMGTSKLGTVKWDRALAAKGLVATARNWRTTTKLCELLDG